VLDVFVARSMFHEAWLGKRGIVEAEYRGGAALPGATYDDDALARRMGAADAVRDAFEQMSTMVLSMAGPEHRITAMNAAFRALLGRSDLIGVPLRDAIPEVAGQQILELLDRVYQSGEPESGRAWRAQVDLGSEGLQEVYGDFTAKPLRTADGTITGVLVTGLDVSLQVLERRMAQEQAAGAELRYAAARGLVAELQEVLLPPALPMLPRVTIAARYLVAGQDQAAGGDWFDAVTLANGSVVLIVGDLVGHGMAASAAMGQLRAVLNELLIVEPDLAEVLRRADTFAARTPPLRAATLALAVLDPANGTLRYTTCGHPPPLIVAGDGSRSVFLDGTGTGPLGTGSTPVLATTTLHEGELVLMYSDGLIERPNRTISDGMAELAIVAADAVANRVLPAGAAPTPVERVCQLTVELLTRTGYADDVTVLAAQRLAEPVPTLRLDLPGDLDSVTAARRGLGQWFDQFDVGPADRDALLLAVTEAVTNAVEHAYRPQRRGPVRVDAALCDDGYLACRITDHGEWKPPDPSLAHRGHGLMVAGHVVDDMTVSRVPRDAGDPPESGGTVVTLRHRLRRPAILASDASAHAARFPPEPPFAVDIGGDGRGPHAGVCGPVDITSADRLERQLMSASRGGTLSLTVDLTRVTRLASAGVRALYLVRERLAAHQQKLTLVAAPGSSAGIVLKLVRLPHVAG
jgi:serine phosphatase RsbU (regulator of sigma subunit)/anti-sigma regulatory factor (Ser/Thr protein kinase)/ABC-type transporter Mla MlaB component